MRDAEGERARLTERRFDALRLHGPGTDLTIGLLPSAHWAAGDLVTVDGRRHSPNLPTEEVFTTPDPERVDGHVTATMPLELSGSVDLGHPRRVRGRPRDQDRRRPGRGRASRSRFPRRRRQRGSGRSRSSTTRGASGRSRRSSWTRSSTRTPQRTSRSVTATTTRSRIPRTRPGSTRARSTSTS